MKNPAPAEHLPRLTRALAHLLAERRTGALATLAEDGSPFVSLVPFALEPERGWLVLHVSALAEHAANLAARPGVSLLIAQGEVADAPVHALARVSLQGRALALEPGSTDWGDCRAAYLERFPEAEPMTHFADFRFVAIEPVAARQVAGFGAARTLDAQELRLALSAARSLP